MAGTTIGNSGIYRYGYLAGAGVNREDLVDFIANVDPSEAPLLSMLPKTQARHVVHEWLTDTLSAVSNTGAVEGADFALDPTTTPQRVLNQCMIFRKDIAVTGTQRAVNPAGFKDAYAYEIEKGTRELTRNIDYTILSPASSATGASNTGRVMKTLETLLTTNVFTAANYTGVAGDATHAGVIVFNDVNSSLQTIFDAGGKTDTIVLGSVYKRQFSNMTLTQQNRNILAAEKKIIVGIDVIDTDFGIMTILLDRWSPKSTNTGTATANATDVSGRVWLLQRSMVRIAWLRQMQHELIGKRGDSVAGFILGECTLEVANEKSCGVMRGVNNKSSIT